MMDRFVNLYEKFLELQQRYKYSTSYTANCYYADLLHLASEANHMYVSARKQAVKELCRLGWYTIDQERLRIRQQCRNDVVTQQATSPQ